MSNIQFRCPECDIEMLDGGSTYICPLCGGHSIGNTCTESISSDNVLGHNLIRLRKQRRWTQVMLADIAGVSGPAISQLESGVSLGHVRTLQKIAGALGVTVSELLDGV